jgi:hypothetical protein
MHSVIYKISDTWNQRIFCPYLLYSSLSSKDGCRNLQPRMAGPLNINASFYLNNFAFLGNATNLHFFRDLNGFAFFREH